MKSMTKRYRLSRYHVRAIQGLAIILAAIMAGTILYTIQLELTDPAAVPRLKQPDPGVIAALHVITFASHQADFLCHLLTSAVINGVSIKVLGYDNDKVDVLFRKIPVTLAELYSRQPDDIVMFVDAFDVIITGSPDEIISEFQKTGSDLVFAAEMGCWPFMDGRPEGRSICEEKYPASPTPYKYLNSGAWIGYAHAAVKAFEEMLSLPEAEQRAIDQELASIVFLQSRERYHISLDYEARIFQCVHLSFDDLQFHPVNQKTLIYNQRTKTYPKILHFNGNGKEVQELFHQQLGFNRPDLLDPDHLKLASGQLIQGLRYLDVCQIINT